MFKDGNLEHLTSAGIPLNMMEEIQQQTIHWQDVSKILLPEFCFGRSYFIPHESVIELPENILRINRLLVAEQEFDENTSQWKHQDILIIPLIKPNGVPLGLINVSSPTDQNRPDSPTFETLEIFASQASLIIESQEKLANLDSQITDLSDKLLQYSEAHEQLPKLLEKERDQSNQILAINQSTQRFISGLNIIDMLNKLPDRLAVLSALGDETVSALGMDVAIIAEASTKGPKLLHISGIFPDSTNPDALLGQRNPLTEVLKRR